MLRLVLIIHETLASKDRIHETEAVHHCNNAAATADGRSMSFSKVQYSMYIHKLYCNCWILVLKIYVLHAFSHHSQSTPATLQWANLAELMVNDHML